ncbi:unnamed protein product [Symbiodinium sp. CCMP2592]|nr:unnamed protein product [Symbiodinium sp. CCMP2592]
MDWVFAFLDSAPLLRSQGLAFSPSSRAHAPPTPLLPTCGALFHGPLSVGEFADEVFSCLGVAVERSAALAEQFVYAERGNKKEGEVLVPVRSVGGELGPGDPYTGSLAAGFEALQNDREMCQAAAVVFDVIYVARGHDPSTCAGEVARDTSSEETVAAMTQWVLGGVLGYAPLLGIPPSTDVQSEDRRSPACRTWCESAGSLGVPVYSPAEMLVAAVASDLLLLLNGCYAARLSTSPADVRVPSGAVCLAILPAAGSDGCSLLTACRWTFLPWPADATVPLAAVGQSASNAPMQMWPPLLTRGRRKRACPPRAPRHVVMSCKASAPAADMLRDDIEAELQTLATAESLRQAARAWQHKARADALPLNARNKTLCAGPSCPHGGGLWFSPGVSAVHSRFSLSSVGPSCVRLLLWPDSDDCRWNCGARPAYLRPDAAALCVVVPRPLWAISYSASSMLPTPAKPELAPKQLSHPCCGLSMFGGGCWHAPANVVARIPAACNLQRLLLLASQALDFLVPLFPV